MNLSDLHEHLVQRMAETRKEYAELSEMIENAKADEIDYKDWPQYNDYLKFQVQWSTYRELKELVADMLSHELIVSQEIDDELERPLRCMP